MALVDTQLCLDRPSLDLPISAVERAAAEDNLLPAWLRRPDGRLPRSAEDIIAATARRAGLSRSEIRAGRRAAPIVSARHEAAYWLARLTVHSTVVIGNMLGGRDHTTILNAIHRHAERAGLPDINLAFRKIKRYGTSHAEDIEEAERRRAERASIFEAKAEARRAQSEELARRVGEESQRSYAKHRARVNSCTIAAARWCAANDVAFWQFSEPHISKATRAMRAALIRRLKEARYSRIEIIDALGIGDKSYRSAVAVRIDAGEA